VDSITVTRSNADAALGDLERELRQRTRAAIEQHQSTSDRRDIRVAIDEASDVFTRDNAARWGAVACAGRKLGLHFDVHAHQWNLAVFHDSALRAACAHAHNVDTTDTAVLLGQPTRTGCAACV